MLMTKLFIKCPIDSKRRCQSDLISLVINENTQELLKYQSMEKEIKCKINDNFEFKQNKHSHLYVTMGLIDCDIDIVGQNIISILEDFSHFDEFKDEFINHVTKSEIISDKIYVHEVEGDNYFLRVSNPQLYYQSFIDGVQRHIISDESVKFNAESFILHDCFTISSEDSVDFKSINESNGSVWIGSSTAVAENTIIDSTCIGREWKISENCRITESIIWDKVTIGAGSEIYNCIITQGIVITPGSHFKNVLLLSNGDQEQNFTEHAIEISKFKKISDGNETDESDLLDEESDEDDNKNSNNSFLDEIKAIINRQISEEHSLDAIKVEINTVRFSDNKTLTECCGAVITALIDYVMIQSDQTIQSSIKSIEKLFNQYSGMLKSFVTTKSDQASLIENIEKSWIDHSTLTSGFHLLLQILWKSKLLTSESVIDWYQTEIEDAHELRTKFLNWSKKFVEYLKSQEEDSGEEEEDEEENE